MKTFVAEWPLVSEKRVRALDDGAIARPSRVECRLATWQEHWGKDVADDVFAKTAPALVKLLRILLVQCHGGIENERSFSGMNFIHTDARNSLGNKHMNAAVRAWSEKDKMLAGDHLFAKMWHKFQTSGLPR